MKRMSTDGTPSGIAYTNHFPWISRTGGGDVAREEEGREGAVRSSADSVGFTILLL